MIYANDKKGRIMKKCNYARNEIAEYKSDLNICCADCQLEARIEPTSLIAVLQEKIREGIRLWEEAMKEFKVYKIANSFFLNR